MFPIFNPYPVYVSPNMIEYPYPPGFLDPYPIGRFSFGNLWVVPAAVFYLWRYASNTGIILLWKDVIKFNFRCPPCVFFVFFYKGCFPITLATFLGLSYCPLKYFALIGPLYMTLISSLVVLSPDIYIYLFRISFILYQWWLWCMWVKYFTHKQCLIYIA